MKAKPRLITDKCLPSKINEKMTLTIKGTELKLVTSVKLLGLEIDSELFYFPFEETL